MTPLGGELSREWKRRKRLSLELGSPLTPNILAIPTTPSAGGRSSGRRSVVPDLAVQANDESSPSKAIEANIRAISSGPISPQSPLRSNSQRAATTHSPSVHTNPRIDITALIPSLP